jgi:hypothetical protein
MKKKPIKSDEQWLTKTEMAARLKKHPKTLDRWMRLGWIPFVKVGKHRSAPVHFIWSDVLDSFRRRFGTEADAN